MKIASERISASIPRLRENHARKAFGSGTPAAQSKKSSRRICAGNGENAAAYLRSSGSVRIKRVDSASDSARRAPLCSAAMVWAMDRPRPKPDFSPREASAR